MGRILGRGEEVEWPEAGSLLVLLEFVDDRRPVILEMGEIELVALDWES